MGGLLPSRDTGCYNYGASNFQISQYTAFFQKKEIQSEKPITSFSILYIW